MQVKTKAAPFAGILCRIHGAVDISEAQYETQMERSSRPWVCPKCNNVALFDDLRFEALHQQELRKSDLQFNRSEASGKILLTTL